MDAANVKSWQDNVAQVLCKQISCLEQDELPYVYAKLISLYLTPLKNFGGGLPLPPPAD